jgi:cysteine desulfurase NifS
MKTIYLDYNATTPVDPMVAEAMLPYLHQHFGNPSSGHIFGATTKNALEKARRQVAEMLHCDPDQVIFTGGGSESNNTAIKGVAGACKDKGNHIITSAIEHPSVIEVCRYLEKNDYKVTYLAVDEYGLVDPQQVEKSITPQTILITIMHANNETGTIEPISEIADIARRYDILLHTDCAQSVGKIPVRIDELNVDLLTIAGHKIYAPKGIGALYIRKGTKLEKLIHGGGQEMDWRAGTENILEIVGLGEACQIINRNLSAFQGHMQKMRDRLEHGLKERFSDMRINGHTEQRLPNTLSVGFKGLQANTIISELKNIAISAGSACHSDRVGDSGVLSAMGTPAEYAMGTLRISVGRFTTDEEIAQALDRLTLVVQKLKQPT